jgi:shikimate dehydrogenase
MVSAGAVDVAAKIRLGVVGWPVAHSRSPAIQNAALEALGLSDWRYQLLPIPPELFAETVGALSTAGFRGVNVTIPHKEAALALARKPTARAEAIGAANTLIFEADGRIAADNTDAPGLIDALPFGPAGRTALVLGAGGSARAVVWALQDAGAREIRIWNRTPERARSLARDLGGVPVDAAAPADLLVHCTASGLDPAQDAFKPLPIDPDDVTSYECVVDLVYGDTETPLVQAARARHVRVVGGRELLVRQGALSFELFTGRAAPIDVMRQAADVR